jgi:hypothetical protein
MVYGYKAISGVTLTATYAPDDSSALSISDASITEGNAGSSVMNFTVNLSAPSAAPVGFDIATQPGTASEGVDYVGKALTGQSIPAGATSANFSVTVNGDTAVEGNETFAVELSNVTGAPVADGQGQGRIINDDLAQLRIGDVTVAEGNSGTSTASFEVTLSEPMPSPVTFDIATSNGSAVAGSDYLATSKAGRYLDAGRTRLLFEVPVIGDATAEANETFNVNISNVSGATLADGSAVGTIVNDDGAALAATQMASQSVLVSPVVLGFDGEPLDADGKAACRPAGQRRGRLEPALPTCTKAQAAALARKPSRH